MTMNKPNNLLLHSKPVLLVKMYNSIVIFNNGTKYLYNVYGNYKNEHILRLNMHLLGIN